MFDLGIEIFDGALDAGSDIFFDDLSTMVFLGDAGVHKLPPTQHKCLQTGLICSWQHGEARPGPLAKRGENAGIDQIGFGEPPDALGEVSDLPRIDACERHALGCERRHDDGLVAAG